MIQNNITPIVIVLAAVCAVALAFIVYLYLKIRKVESECEFLARDTEGRNFLEIVNDNIVQTDKLLEEVEALSERYAFVLRRMAGAVQHVGVVRYDAFRDLGGLLSFSVALLDDRANGLVVSSIYGRSESRTYTKPIIERSSTYDLSPEEREAIRLAMQSKEKGALPIESRDREHDEKIATLKLFHDKEFFRPERPARREVGERRPASRPRPEPRPQRTRPEPRPEREEPEPKPEREKPTAEREAPRPRAGKARQEKAGAAARPGARERREQKPAGKPPAAAGAPEKGVAKGEKGKPEKKPFDQFEEGAGKKPSGGKKAGGPRGREAGRRETAPRPRSLDTPVDRLRRREPEGD